MGYFKLSRLCPFAAAMFLFLSSFAQDGMPDPSFGSGGKIITPISIGYDAGYGLAIQPDGKILVSGEAENGNSGSDYNIVLARYNTDGSLDAGFGNGGIIVRAIGNGWDLSGSVLVQPDGKIVVGGNGWSGSDYDFVALRYNQDGSPDNSFGTEGLARVRVGPSQDYGWGCALQPDGKILLVGPVNNGSNLDFGVVRLQSNGSLDNSFGNGGKVILPLGPADDHSWSCTVQPDGRILLSGRREANGIRSFAMARLNANGTLDSSFGAGGIVLASIGGVSDNGRLTVLQPDGKILFGGTSMIEGTDDFVLVRYLANGSPDHTFGANGVVTTAVGTSEDVLWGLAVLPNGKIVAAGYGISNVSGYDFALVRYNTDGSLDASFGANGIVLAPIGNGNDFGNNIAIQADGKIVMCGASVSASYDLAVARFQNTLASTTSAAGEEIFLFDCYPDPFESATQVRFQILHGVRAALTVHDLMGRKVATLADEYLPAGRHERTFEANGLAPGIYIFRLKTDAGEQSRKAILAR